MRSLFYCIGTNEFTTSKTTTSTNLLPPRTRIPNHFPSRPLHCLTNLAPCCPLPRTTADSPRGKKLALTVFQLPVAQCPIFHSGPTSSRQSLCSLAGILELPPFETSSIPHSQCELDSTTSLVGPRPVVSGPLPPDPSGSSGIINTSPHMLRVRVRA